MGVYSLCISIQNTLKMKRISEITVAVLTFLLSVSHAVSIYWFEDVKETLQSNAGLTFADCTPFVALAFSLVWIVRPAMDELGIISIAGTVVFLSAFVGEYGNYLVQKVWPEGGLADQVDLLADAGFLDPYGLYCLYASFAAACLTIILCVWTLYLLGVKATSVVEADKDSQVKTTEETPDSDKVAETVAVVNETAIEPTTETETVTVPDVSLIDQETEPELVAEPQVEPEPETEAELEPEL